LVLAVDQVVVSAAVLVVGVIFVVAVLVAADFAIRVIPIAITAAGLFGRLFT
jgi:hypothetical protein